MIKCDKGGTKIEGTIPETIQDFMNIINAVRISLEDELNPEDAAEIIKQCGRWAYSYGGNNPEEEAEALSGIMETLLQNGKM